MSEWEHKEAGELPQCENCDQYSRARADQQAETEEQWKSFLVFIARRKADVEHLLKEYAGSNKSRDSKFMAGIYRGEIRSYDDLLYWAKFFLEIEPEDTGIIKPTTP